MPRGFDLPTRQIREAHGLIWYWYGESAPAAEIPWFPEAPDPSPRTSFVQRDYPVSYLRVMENLGDMHHVPCVHRATIPGAGSRVEVQEAQLERRSHSNEGLAASRTIRLDADDLQLHLRHPLTYPRDD